MKVQFRKNIRSYSGENEDVVYQSYKRGWVCIGRDFVIPKLTENNTNMGLIGKNLAHVFRNISPTYALDLKKYADRNNSDNVNKKEIAPNAYALFVKMMFAWLKSDSEHVNLTAVTVADIVALDADVVTVKRAIDAGFLHTVRTYADLNAGIQ